MTDKTSSKISVIIKTAAGILLMSTLFFVPAGTLHWPEAWLLLISYILIVGGMILWLKKKNPELLKERTEASKKKNVKTWDRWIILVYTLLLLTMIVITGLDAVRFRWSQVPLILKIIGVLGFIPAILLGFSSMVHNRFLSERVRIQKDRDHQVCSAGPYRHVRHPMYVGIILAILCFPLALGSFFAFIPAVLIILLFFLRTYLEDKTLQEELPGYKEYSEKVRYRLIPKIW
jgi:protein-S-isoprenylcysteine O-methyltransferase Ste14